ncbi:hypothetical protein AXK58_19285 [Tsukamurella tyrosinosolvens]|nr:hypothetical protein [Tsukamurella tyrosinosolvens]KXO92741.1 hypothetical protein AXK58_19285 [Tsukamurella tyrosinosolvens]
MPVLDLQQPGRRESAKSLTRTIEHGRLHPLDVGLDDVDAIQPGRSDDGVQCDHLDVEVVESGELLVVRASPRCDRAATDDGTASPARYLEGDASRLRTNSAPDHVELRRPQQSTHPSEPAAQHRVGFDDEGAAERSCRAELCCVETIFTADVQADGIHRE